MCALLQCMTEMTLRESLHYKVTIENTNHRSYSHCNVLSFFLEKGRPLKSVVYKKLRMKTISRYKSLFACRISQANKKKKGKEEKKREKRNCSISFAVEIKDYALCF